MKVCLLIVIAWQISLTYSCENDRVLSLNDIELRSPETVSDYWDTGNGIVLNDADLTPGWYRAVHNGWQYLMTDVSNKPDYMACHSYYPIFMKEKHTPVDDLQETPTDATACIRDDFYPCSSKYSIQVRKCNGEIQYKLQPTAWYSAYCFEKHSEYSRRPAAPENVDLKEIIVLPQLHFSENSARTGRLFMIPHNTFRCSFNFEKQYFYTVSWYIDDNQFETMGPSNFEDDLALHDTQLDSRNISYGIDIHCGVSVSASFNGIRTPMNFSRKFYAGIQVLNTSISLDKESSATIQMVSTVPIGCGYPKTVRGWIPNNLCKIGMKLFVPDHDPLDCRKTSSGSVLNQVPGVENQMCVKQIKTLTEKDIDTWRADVPFNFTVVTSDHTYEDDSEFILKLQFGATMEHAIWKNHIFPDIKIFVKNMEQYQSKICRSRNDPHMHTADGYSYEQQEEEGTYMLYLHKKNKIEVQQITERCNYGLPLAKCTCGVAIRAGQDVFMINKCGIAKLLAFTQCGDGGILDVVRMHDLSYRVFTPIGTRIEISLTGVRSKWMNVEITMAPKDMNNVVGLCGKFDGDKNNDLQHRNGHTTSPLGKHRWKNYHPDFVSSWKIAADSDENLFKPSIRRLTKWSQQNGLYCACISKEHKSEALCSSSLFLNCTHTDSITKTKCHVKHRRKRHTGNQSDKEIIRLLTLSTRKIDHYSNRKKREADTSVIISEDATDFCNKKIKGSLALNDFKYVSANEDADTITYQCAFDISIMNDTSWADVHLEAVNDGVKNMMDLQPTYVANNTDEVDVFLKNTCPKNCSSKGNCSDLGVCSCFTYFRGPDCSIDERDGLTILDIEGGGICDIADGEECECFYVRSDSIQENFTCSVTVLKIRRHGDVEFVSSSTLEGGFEDIFTGICCAPVNILGSSDVFVAKYDVQISNNGFHFGNNESVYVYDSTCQNIEESANGTKLFTLKGGHCFIDGYCFTDNDMSMIGCLACQSSKALYNWTEYNPCQNGGNCTDRTYGYVCNCVAGYGGINCDFEINECLSDPCRNGGNCTDLFNSYSCTCMEGFVGVDCEINIDECLSNPCKNGGLCIDQVNKYQCNCSAGFEGRNCENEIDECVPNPCQNGGTCSDYINGYTCTCTEGFYSSDCSAERNNCEANPCQNGGTCTSGTSGRICNCLAGYEGMSCELNIYECSSNPCLNGGSCQDRINGYVCKCVAGYNGSFCELDINECATNPCQNGGTCKDLVAEYNCICILGYQGSMCEIDIDECFDEPCQNGGTCTDQVNEYNCSCVAGYEGTTCEKDIDECSSNPCQNGGTCTDLVAEFNCSCGAGYEGVSCEVDINECATNPCQNGGTCKDLVAEYNCTCIHGYQGSMCEIDIDECSVEPCQNGGTCTDQVNGYDCSCVAGYEGTTCEKDINECSSNPCQNGGTCTDLVADFNCSCGAGYEGVNCKVDIDECSVEPCQNGGTCTDQVNGYNCLCVAGYEGKTCEKDINECSSDPCQNGDACTDLVAEFNCSCGTGYEGAKCDNNTNST